MGEETEIGRVNGWRYFIVARENGFEVLRQKIHCGQVEESLLVADTLKAATRKGVAVMIHGTRALRIKTRRPQQGGCLQNRIAEKSKIKST